MNRATSRFLVVLGLLLPLVVVANAGSQKANELVADIPFNFTVCKEQMPAGKYKVFPISRANPRLLLVRGEDNRSMEIVCTNDVESSKISADTRLIFNRYGDRYFLSQMWVQGEKTGNQLIKTEEEQALLKEWAPKKKAEKVTVTVTELKPN